MKINAAGLKIIKDSEGLELSAYPDPESPLGKACASKGLLMRDYKKVINWMQLSGMPWTVGYGHTGSDVKEGLTIDLLAAEMLIKEDVEFAEQAVETLVTIELSPNEFSALVSLTYNIGMGKFKSSTLLKLLNAGDVQGAARQILAWDKDEGKVSKGLAKRRKAEQTLFLSP